MAAALAAVHLPHHRQICFILNSWRTEQYSTSWCATPASSLSCRLPSNSHRTTQRASVRLDRRHVWRLWMLAVFSGCRQLDAGPETLMSVRWKHCKEAGSSWRIIYLKNRRAALVASEVTQNSWEKLSDWDVLFFFYRSATMRYDRLFSLCLSLSSSPYYDFTVINQLQDSLTAHKKNIIKNWEGSTTTTFLRRVQVDLEPSSCLLQSQTGHFRQE